MQKIKNKKIKCPWAHLGCRFHEVLVLYKSNNISEQGILCRLLVIVWGFIPKI